MTIDFHDARNAGTYATRSADPGWIDQMSSLLGDRTPGTVVDIGCGGGIYSRAWRDLGASAVIGLDFSAQMIADASAAGGNEGISFRVSSAYDTGMEDASVDIVFSRAVIHHLDDRDAAFREAFRILKPGGMVIVQDRTIEDVLQPASLHHFRARFFTMFPRLLEEERLRRPALTAFAEVLGRSGFRQPQVQHFWEDRTKYANEEALRADLRSRTGRSILHALSDDELAQLTDSIVEDRVGHFPLVERDRWTVWTAIRPASGG